MTNNRSEGLWNDNISCTECLQLNLDHVLLLRSNSKRPCTPFTLHSYVRQQLLRALAETRARSEKWEYWGNARYIFRLQFQRVNTKDQTAFSRLCFRLLISESFWLSGTFVGRTLRSVGRACGLALPWCRWSWLRSVTLASLCYVLGYVWDTFRAHSCAFFFVMHVGTLVYIYIFT